MRDYDPTTGRYLQADPLGLVDGASVYGYAGQNPARWTDPTGEFIPVVVGLLVGLLLDYALDVIAEKCDCDSPGLLPDNKYTVLGIVSGGTGAFVGGKTGGVAGGGKSGHRTSVWSTYGGKVVRDQGRRAARKLPYVGLMFVTNDLWRFRRCIF